MAPTLSPALFSHPPLAAQCLGYVRCPPSSPSLSAERRKIPFSIEGYPMPQIVAFAGPAGPAFSFSAFLLPVCSPSCVEGLAFSHPGLPLSWIRSQLAHTPPTGRVCCFAGVVPLPGPQSRTQGHTGASLVFLRRTNLPLFLKGEGLGIAFLGFAGFALLVHNRATLAQQGLSGPLLVLFPCPAL